jgi:hypothetical protein
MPLTNERDFRDSASQAPLFGSNNDAWKISRQTDKDWLNGGSYNAEVWGDRVII